MRILVVDDFHSAWFLLSAVLDADHHHLDWSPDPADAARKVKSARYGLALVDLDFGRGAPESGLTALRVLHDEGVPCLVHSADAEENRLLYLLAAFQFFQPLGLLSRAGSAQDMRAVVAAVETGEPLGPRFIAAAYRPRRGLEPWLDRLLHNDLDLALWRQLTRYSNRTALAAAAKTATGTVDKFTGRQIDVVRDLRMSFGRWDAAPVPDGDGRVDRLAPLHAFAVTHSRFFADPEVERLVRARSRPERRRRPGF